MMTMAMMLKVITLSWLHTIERLKELFWNLLRTKLYVAFAFPIVLSKTLGIQSLLL